MSNKREMYHRLAGWYDKLTEDVDYERLADYYETQANKAEGETEIILDLACGTGSLTTILAKRGYQMIGVDVAADMLMVAREKGADVLYLQQDARTLNLYGTVDAVICSLDGLNYIPPDALFEVFRRVFLFLNPGGIFAFDIHKPEKLMAQDGEVFCDEGDDFLCLWRSSFDATLKACQYDFDLFEKIGHNWKRTQETHLEYAHAPEQIEKMLAEIGFCEITQTETGQADAPTLGQGRIFITARCRKEGTTWIN